MCQCIDHLWTKCIDTERGFALINEWAHIILTITSKTKAHQIAVSVQQARSQQQKVKCFHTNGVKYANECVNPSFNLPEV